MPKDFLKELEYLGVTARIKRLSDSLYYSIKDLYASQDIDIEPSWHLVFLILKLKGSLNLMELAVELNLSKPALTKMVNKMLSMGYINVVVDQTDKRKKNVSLSKKGISALPRFERVWEAGEKAVQEMLTKNQHFLSSLSKFENKQTKLNFKDRATKFLQ